MNKSYFITADEVLEELYENCDRVADFEIAVYLHMRYGCAYNFDSEEQFKKLRECFNSMKTIFSEELNNRVEDILAEREDENDDTGNDDEPNVISYEEIRDWLMEHKQAWEDYCSAYYLHGRDSILEWISEHRTLSEDFDMHFGIDIDELL